MLETLIKDGLVVSPGKTSIMDIGIQNGKIDLLIDSGSIDLEATRVINADGKIVIPGGVETHAHIAEPMHRGWTRGEENWLPSSDVVSKAAIIGGTTTIASFAFLDVHTTKIEFDANIAIEQRKSLFNGNTYADFVFHPVITGQPSERTISTIKDAIIDGTPTYKLFTTDVTSEQSGIKIDDGYILEVMKVVGRNNGLIFTHAENDELVKFMEAKLKKDGNDQWYNLHLVHTNLSEGIAFNKVIRLASQANVPLLFAHVTGKSGVEEIEKARRAGLPVYGEVLHNYLAYTAEDYKKPDGGKYQTYPALKTEEDRQSLWSGLVRGVISIVATDEYTTSYKIKTQGKTISTACGGHAGIETRGIYTFSEGYKKGKLSLERFVDVFSTSPAKVLGLYPQKGIIAPGSDADIVIWDPNIQKTITLADLNHGTDYSIWEGWDVEGWPITTLLRGKVMVENRKFLGSKDDGIFIKRKLSRDVLTRPVC